MQKEKNKNRKKGDFLFCGIILLLCVCIVGLLKKDVPAVFGYRILHVVSGSMEPYIGEGSYIIVKETDAAELKIGETITFISEEPAIYGMYNTHRIYDICKDTYTGETLFITKGDAHQDTDAYPVKENQIVGKVVKVLPFGKSIGKMLAHLSNNYVYFGLIIIPLLLCLISYIVQLIREVAKKDEE